MADVYWIPESRIEAGRYPLGSGPGETKDVHKAIRFFTESECQAWCELYTDFRPEEHLFVGDDEVFHVPF